MVTPSHWLLINAKHIAVSRPLLIFGQLAPEHLNELVVANRVHNRVASQVVFYVGMHVFAYKVACVGEGERFGNDCHCDILLVKHRYLAGAGVSISEWESLLPQQRLLFFVLYLNWYGFILTHSY